MAEYNFVRGYEVYKERTLSLVTLGYQEIAAYVESSLLEANDLPVTDDARRAALYVSCMKGIHRIQVICSHSLY